MNANDEIRLTRRREVARTLGVSQAQVLKFERDGVLRRVEIPGIRAIRYDAREVTALAKRWIEAARMEACATPLGVKG